MLLDYVSQLKLSKKRPSAHSPCEASDVHRPQEMSKIESFFCQRIQPFISESEMLSFLPVKVGIFSLQVQHRCEKAFIRLVKQHVK